MGCQTPLEINGVTVSCQSCDACVSRRIHCWCSRAMMEKETFGHALVLALTYSEETAENHRSARMFDYKDVQDLLKRIREQIERQFKKRSAVSFIAAGEKGDRFGRCHWHIVLFSEMDLTTVGVWTGPFGVCRDRSEIITPSGEIAKRRHWSLWAKDGKPIGFVSVQEPDYGGMRYALSYALKNQFNIRNAEFTARHHTAEVFSGGYLVMSKKPPIGQRWVDAYVQECREKGIVPPTRLLKIQGLDFGYWPNKDLSLRLLSGLASVNEEVKARTGKACGGWSSLVNECKDSENFLEALGVDIGKPEEKPPEESAVFGLRTEDKSKWQQWRDARDRHIVASAIVPPARFCEPGNEENLADFIARANSERAAAAARLEQRAKRRN